MTKHTQAYVAALNPTQRRIAQLGVVFVPIVTQVTDILRVGSLAFYYAFKKPIRWREVVQQSFFIGNRSLAFVMIVLGFLGMILIFQSGFQAKRIVGDLQGMGALYLQLLFREFAPTVTALMLATRVGTGIAAEIGSMVVTEQVDALRDERRGQLDGDAGDLHLGGSEGSKRQRPGRDGEGEPVSGHHDLVFRGARVHGPRLHEGGGADRRV